MQPLHGGIHHNRTLLANKTLISKQYILFRTNYCTLTLITSKSHNALCRSDIQAFVLFKHLSYSSICLVQAFVLFKHLSYSSICLIQASVGLYITVISMLCIFVE